MRKAMMVVDRIKGHSAVWAVLVLKDHRHSSMFMWKCKLGMQKCLERLKVEMIRSKRKG